MKKRHSICVLFLLISIFPGAKAVSFSFRHYKVENGLSENSVFCSLQDSKGFMWFGTKEGLNRFDGHNFVVFHKQPDNKNSLGNSFVHALYEDKGKTLWVGTEKGIYLYSYLLNSFSFFDKRTPQNISIDQSVISITGDTSGNIWIASTNGLYKYNPANDKLVVYQHNKKNPTSINSSYVNCVFCDSKGVVWAGTINGGLTRYNPKTDNFKNYHFTPIKKASIVSVLKIVEDSQGNLILGTISDGLIFFDRKTEKAQNHLLEISSEYIYYFREIFEYSPGVYLIGSEHGLIVFELYNGKATQIRGSAIGINSLSDNAIYSIYKDKEGGIWIGTYFGGVNYISPKPYIFELFSPLENNNSISGKAISQFCEDPNGNLWIATEDGGLNYFDTHKKTFKYYPQSDKNSLSYINVHSLLLDGDNLWIGMFAGGLNIMNTKTGKIKHYTSTSDPHSLNDNNVFSIYKDVTGAIWVGTIEGLNRYNPANDNFDRIGEPLLHTFVCEIFQDNTGLLWLGTSGRGVFSYNPRNKVWKHYDNNPGNPNSISHNKIISIYQDNKKRLWFGTEGGGLCQYLYNKDHFKTYNTSNGLPNNVVYAVVSDRDYLWVSSNKGITRFNPDNMDIKVFTKADGLQGDQFNFKSGYKARNGKIYFGGTNGFNAFYPDELRDNKYVPPIAITNIQLFNKDIPIGKSGSPLKQSITFTDEITLSYNQSFLNFEFVALSFCAPDKNQYAYKLEGFDKHWINAGNDHKISYTNLPPGRYTLIIKGSNNDGVWNNEGVKLRIRILPPFWASIWAYLFYIIAFIALAYYILKYYQNKRKKEEQIRLERIQTQSEIDLYNAKIDFFTNIAHEIRTPLSLIKAPLESLRKKNKDGDSEEYISVMERNTNRLMALINQLLDFRKAEKNSYVVNFKQANINEFLQAIYDSFKHFTDSKLLKFELKLPEEPLVVQADVECMTKIVSNLLSNAIKHAKTKVVLSLVVDKKNQDYYEIQVFDDGDGINDTEKDKIFQPFYQIKKDKTQNKGTGIGLALVKLLVEIHGGKIEVESSVNKFTCFTVIFPTFKNLITDQDAEIQLPEQIIVPDIAPKESKTKEFYLKNNELPALLIVEDNEELNHFLVTYLQENFTVMSAENGSVAVKILENFSPDLIISDIMMPEMNGLELCQYVKTNTLYSHIPVVLLTAKTDIKFKIEGLEQGADAYLEKPFSVEHLEAQVINLLESRERLKENFISSPLTPVKSIGKNKADEAFLSEITNIIEANISDIDFSVDDLAQQIAMSRSNLYRKVKGLSGLTPNDFIRLVRLKKAVKLMQDGETRINEICFMVGFNTSSYFAKCFKSQFGILPKDFVKNQ